MANTTVDPRDITVCTAIADRKDSLLPCLRDGCNHVAFYDEPGKQSPGWDVRLLERFCDLGDWAARVDSRVPKILTQYYLDYKYMIWVDGIRLPKDPIALVQKYIIDADADVAFWAHNRRDCIYEEGEAVIRHGVDDPSLVENQLDTYRDLGHPEHYGLYHTTCFIKRNSPIVKRFELRWWYHYSKFSARDQLSLPYVLRSLERSRRSGEWIELNIIPGLLNDHAPAVRGHNW